MAEYILEMNGITKNIPTQAGMGGGSSDGEKR